MILASFGSVLIHLLVLAFFALVIALQPPAPPKHPDHPIRLTIVPKEPEPVLAVQPTPPPRRKTVIIPDMPEAEHPPKDALVDADKDTAASSEIAPTGKAPLPSQDGKAIPAFMFDTHPFVAATDTAPRQEPAATPVPETAPPLPKPDAQAPKPLPAAPPAATPGRAMPTAAPDEFAMIEATPTPAPPDFDPFVRTPDTEPPRPTPVASRATPRPSSAAEEKTLIHGDLSNHGPSSIAATATPEGRYSKAVSDAIRVRWYARISSQMDIASFGTVKIHFSVDRRGKVVAPHVISNSGNEALASISLQAIMDASIPPLPPEVAASTNNEDLPLDFDFSLY